AELYAMAASCVRAQHMAKGAGAEGPKAVHMADVFCAAARLRIDDLFGRLFDNADDRVYRLAQEVLRGEHAWLEDGAIQMIPDDVNLAPPEAGAWRETYGERHLSGATKETQLGAG
ncbi:MAG TPA: hypothetical protein VFL93_08045, partial [Longimicrobiaceae bacterium]|nr:hypothetical protein [Longimicrobiaceae bacterium]